MSWAVQDLRLELLRWEAIRGRKLLFLSLLDDLSWAPRPMAEFARLGCESAVLCAPGSASSKTQFAAGRFYLPCLRHLPLRLLAARFWVERVCHDWQPDLIVPLDSFAGWLLRGLATNQSVSAKLRFLPEYSLGLTSGYEAACSRTKFLELASRIGVRVPASLAVDRATALSAASAIGFPVMVKLNQSDAGDGVARAQDAAALMAGIDALGLGHRSLLRRTKTAAWRFFWKRAGAWPAPGKIFELQQFIPGVPAMHIVAAWQGRLLAGVSFLKAVVNPQPFGPSTVIRYIENAEMRASATTLVKALGLSGFASFDFVISKDDEPFLIELNPRCTPALHLGRLFGHDLCGSLARHLGWLEEPLETALLPQETAVALFPNEMERDPESAWLDSKSGVLHDIPRDDPDVVKHCYHRLLQLHPSHSHGIAHLLRTEDVKMAMPV
jgi:hypothetical protein